MVADAEAHANEDRERKEEAEARNSADSMVYQTEKMISDNAEKIGEDEKTDIEEKIATLKTSLEGDEIDIESVKNAMEDLTIASQGFAQRLYETAAQEADAQEDESEDIIDAEIIDEDE
jgi:molecular chaperone DnaK